MKKTVNNTNERVQANICSDSYEARFAASKARRHANKKSAGKAKITAIILTAALFVSAGAALAIFSFNNGHQNNAPAITTVSASAKELSQSGNQNNSEDTEYNTAAPYEENNNVNSSENNTVAPYEENNNVNSSENNTVAASGENNSNSDGNNVEYNTVAAYEENNSNSGNEADADSEENNGGNTVEQKTESGNAEANADANDDNGGDYVEFNTVAEYHE